MKRKLQKIDREKMKKAKIRLLEKREEMLLTQIERLEAKRDKVADEIFFVTTGYRIGQTFEFEGRNYRIVNWTWVRNVDGQRRRWAPHLEDYLKGLVASPFNRNPGVK
jgi:hypothetical protein